MDICMYMYMHSQQNIKFDTATTSRNWFTIPCSAAQCSAFSPKFTFSKINRVTSEKSIKILRLFPLTVHGTENIN